MEEKRIVVVGNTENATRRQSGDVDKYLAPLYPISFGRLDSGTIILRRCANKLNLRVRVMRLDDLFSVPANGHRPFDAAAAGPLPRRSQEGYRVDLVSRGAEQVEVERE